MGRKTINSVKRKIINCFECKGQGTVSWDYCIDYHRREFAEETKKCSECDGTGRIVKIVKFEKFIEREVTQ